MRTLSKENVVIQTTGAANRTLCWLSLILFLGPAEVLGNDAKAPDTAGNVGRFTSLALNAKGNPVVSYHDLTNRDLKLLRCNDSTCDANEPGNIYVLDSTGMVGTYTSLALDSSGKPVVSYYDSSNGVLKLLHCISSDCANSSVSIPESSSGVGMYSSLALDAAGNPVVSYYDDSNGDLKLLHCDDPSCTGDESGNISTPDTTDDVGLYTSLVLDHAGRSVISYYASNSGLKLLHCDDPNCKGNESGNIVVADKGEVGWFSSLALDAAGNPVISYYDFSNGDLKILHCDDPNCAGDESKNITTPDTAGDVGSYTSLALDNKGNPVVSYFDTTNGDLRLLHCDDPNCADDENDDISTVDTTGTVGLYTSLVLSAAGNPVVSYYDFSNGDLKLLRCVNPTCNEKRR